MDRRAFLAAITQEVVIAGATSQVSIPAHANEPEPGDTDEQIGVLVDTTKCIGCRKCEFACARANRRHGADIQEFNDMTVFEEPRSRTALRFSACTA